MAADTTHVTQAMLREWHESNFPGLDDAERFRRVFQKWQEETEELFRAIMEGDSIDRKKVGEELADVQLTLMTLAEFGGFSLSLEAINKFNENTNRVWVQCGVDENGFPIWKRERDNRPDLIKSSRK